MREDAVRIADRLEATLRIPDVTPRGIVVVAHPLPTHGGRMRNPLVAALARALADEGFFALRFNFRSVGASSGEWSGGREEWHDVGAAVDHARAFATLPSVAERGPLPPGLPVGVTAYSFGAVMTLRWLEEGGRADGIALVGVPLRGPDQEPRPLPPVPDGTFIVAAENDQFGSADQLRSAIPGARVVIIKSADHFFVGKRDEVGRLVADEMLRALASTVP